MIKELWKAVHVPGLTFANEIVSASAETRAWIERRQRDVGRQSLNCHGNVAIEAIQRDIGWSTFEAREASSKRTYQGRLLHMDRHRWARRVFDYISVNCVQTQWTKPVNQLRKKYGFFTQPVMETTVSKWASEVRRRVKEAETTHWVKEANKKSSLQIYSAHKGPIGPEAYYDNSLGSRLLFEARAGALRTRLYRQRFDPAIESVRCGACGQEDETITHLVLHYTGLTPEWDEARRVHNQGPSQNNTSRDRQTAAVAQAAIGPPAAAALVLPLLPQALGFHPCTDQGNTTDRWTVDVTKRRLENWWRSREKRRK
ncbi:hypothetical protein HPB47_010528 [Ixodes persulcatus]|uniref:Uncharacterized protein n=1 Tax=Ixodes persulcatus TaxID=34615 RepID=A0AC60NZ12_IXOPE|nr:hypothetical protein HPB47_010528 [Ixodes persulcatus]